MSLGQFRVPSPVNEPVKAYAPGSPEKIQIKAELAAQAKTVVDIPLVIGGQHLRTSKTSTVQSPHNHQKKLATVAQAGPAEMEQAIAAAAEGRRDWAALAWHDRAAVFLRAADMLTNSYRVKLNASTMLGQSKTVHQAEIDAACELIDFFRFNAQFAQKIYEEQPYSPAGQWNRSEARALEGFVYAVTPFNFTSIAINLPTAPALMGCSVIWKPAATSMLSSWYGLRLLEEAGLPPGVINLVSGDSAMISDCVFKSKDFAGIHFTGSTGVFNGMWETAGKNMSRYKTYPRMVGETGGKDFIFAHPSARVGALVTAMVRGAFEFQGQKCSAASRAYVPKSLWAQVKERLIASVNALKMGDPVEDFTNFMGAVIDRRAFDKIKSYIDHAKSASDAKIIAGGECDDKVGYFIRPTVIETTNPLFKSMVEEIFGPVLTVYVYDDNKMDDCLTSVDTASPYALTGAIFAEDRRVIASLTRRLEGAAGNFYINDKPTGAVVGQQPFGGARASGTNDKAGSIYNLLRWVSHRSIKETFSPITDIRYPFMDEK